MGKKDTLTKDYMKNTQVFADAFNHLIYQGKKKEFVSDTEIQG